MYAVPMPVEQLVGKTFGNYRIDQFLGQGNLSAAFLARQQHPNQRVMITVFTLPPWCNGSRFSRFMERFSYESSKLVALNHPHILSVYDFGEAFGYPYLVSAFVEEVPLSNILLQQSSCTPLQTLALLKQIAEALDYAHQAGVVHGTLKPVNILLDSQQAVHVTGFGLAHILSMQGIGSVTHPYPHLLSVAETLLYSPEYLAPEVVQGVPVDARSDIYALGIVLYELLCGTPPFTGKDLFEVARKHVNQTITPLHKRNAQIPPALDTILQKALDREPGRRFQAAEKLATSFERVMSVLDAAASSAVANRAPSALLDISQKPTLHWFEAEALPDQQWYPQINPTESVVIQEASASKAMPAMPTAVPWTAVRSTGNTSSHARSLSMKSAAVSSVSQNSVKVPYASFRPSLPSAPLNGLQQNGFSPQFSANQATNVQQDDVANTTQGSQPAKEVAEPPKQQKKTHRRAFLWAAGGVVAAGALAAGGFSLIRIFGMNGLAAMDQAQSKTKVPTSTGTIIGSKTQAPNTAVSFTNPTDTKTALLLHLPDGSFVAYESACTHEGVQVHYDAKSHHFVCPRHGAIFDPAHNGAVLKGPAQKPLQRVQLQINADGSITIAQ